MKTFILKSINKVLGNSEGNVNLTGWQSRTDVVNTQNLLANTDNLISFSGVLAQNGSLSLINTNSKITPVKLNDVITVDFAFTSIVPAGTNIHVFVSIKVNGLIYRSATFPIIKGQGQEDTVSASFAMPVLADFLNNGGLIYVNPTDTMTIKNRYVCVAKVHMGIE